MMKTPIYRSSSKLVRSSWKTYKTSALEYEDVELRNSFLMDRPQLKEMRCDLW